MSNHHALTIRARTLLSQTAVLDVALLETLNRIVKEKVYALESCDSLHTYCVKRLGMSDDSVARRRKAADLLERYPHAVKRIIERREVHLTGLSMLHSVINDENAERLFDEARGKTKYEIELIVARENPKPALASAVTRVPVQASLATQLQESKNSSVEGASLSLTASTQQSPLEQTAPVRSGAEVILPKSKPIEVRAPDIFQFRAMMTAATKQILDEVLDLSTGRDLNVILYEALEALRTELCVRKRAALRRKVPTEQESGQAKTASGTSEGDDAGEMVGPPGDQRHVPAPVRRFVFERDNKECQYVNPKTQEKCCARSNLHIHHVIAWAKGGKTTPDNLTLHCCTHNLYAGEQEFGALKGPASGSKSETLGRGRR